MRINQLKIKNFRSIRNLELDLSESTVLVGPNNAGKTAILDALRIALGGRGGTVFNEYDIHLHNENDDPKDSEGVSIEIISKEKMPGEWSEEIIGALGDTIQQIPGRERGSFLYSVNLRVQYN